MIGAQGDDGGDDNWSIRTDLTTIPTSNVRRITLSPDDMNDDNNNNNGDFRNGINFLLDQLMALLPASDWRHYLNVIQSHMEHIAQSELPGNRIAALFQVLFPDYNVNDKVLQCLSSTIADRFNAAPQSTLSVIRQRTLHLLLDQLLALLPASDWQYFLKVIQSHMEHIAQSELPGNQIAGLFRAHFSDYNVNDEALQRLSSTIADRFNAAPQSTLSVFRERALQPTTAVAAAPAAATGAAAFGAVAGLPPQVNVSNQEETSLGSQISSLTGHSVDNTGTSVEATSIDNTGTAVDANVAPEEPSGVSNMDDVEDVSVAPALGQGFAASNDLAGDMGGYESATLRSLSASGLQLTQGSGDTAAESSSGGGGSDHRSGGRGGGSSGGGGENGTS